jgi:hypothetical protein
VDYSVSLTLVRAYEHGDQRFEPTREFPPLSQEPSHMCRWQVTSDEGPIAIASLCPLTHKKADKHIPGCHVVPSFQNVFSVVSSQKIPISISAQKI